MRPRVISAAGAAAWAVLVTGCATGGAMVGTVPAGPGPGRSASVHMLGVPPGQLPREGQCRVWVAGLPPGQQARSRSCAGILVTAPAGSMILYRVSRDNVRVRYVHESRGGVIVVVRVFAAASGELVSEEQPTAEDREEGEQGQRGRGRRPS